MKYFEMIPDTEAQNPWFLGSPKDAHGKAVNPELFEVSQKVTVDSPLEISVRQNGDPLDFTFADFDMPVANVRTITLLNTIAPDAFETFSAKISGYLGDYAVVNILTARKCLDEKKSQFLKWLETDNRPDKIGQYRQVSEMRIDPAVVHDLDIFRMEGWKIALIVSGKIKDAFVREKISGVSFVSIS